MTKKRLSKVFESWSCFRLVLRRSLLLNTKSKARNQTGFRAVVLNSTILASLVKNLKRNLKNFLNLASLALISSRADTSLTLIR